MSDSSVATQPGKGRGKRPDTAWLTDAVGEIARVLAWIAHPLEPAPDDPIPHSEAFGKSIFEVFGGCAIGDVASCQTFGELAAKLAVDVSRQLAALQPPQQPATTAFDTASAPIIEPETLEALGWFSGYSLTHHATLSKACHGETLPIELVMEALGWAVKTHPGHARQIQRCLGL